MKLPHIPGVDLTPFEAALTDMATSLQRIEVLLADVLTELKISNLIADNK